MIIYRKKKRSIQNETTSMSEENLPKHDLAKRSTEVCQVISRISRIPSSSNSPLDRVTLTQVILVILLVKYVIM